MKMKNSLILVLMCAFQMSTKRADAVSKSEKVALRLLTKFGYRRTWLPRASTDEMQKMFTSFQRFYGLNRTGKLTEDTLEALKKPRCGSADPWDLYGKNLKAEYFLQGTKWTTKKTLTWKVTKIPSNLNIKAITETFKRAFSRWQKHTKKLKFIEAGESGNVDISIQIVSGLHTGPFPFDGKGGSVGHAFYPYTEKGLSGDIHLDADDIKDDTNLDWLATHLIGHSLGIEHIGKQNSIMFPYMKDKNFLGDKFDLPKPDIKALRALYGKGADLTTDNPTKSNPTITTNVVTSTEDTDLSKTTPATTQTKVSTKTPTKTKTLSTVGPTKSTTTEATKKTATSTLPPLPPLLKPCPSLDISALVYYEFHKRLLLFTKSNNLMMITDSGNIYTTKRTSFIPTFGGRLTQVDAALMMIVKGKKCMIIFSAENYFIYHSRFFQFAEGPYSIHTEDDGPLKLKLPKDVTKIDAAMRWKEDGNIYLFSKANFYKYNTISNQIQISDKISDAWKGIPDNIDAAISSNERTYFVKNDLMYQFDSKNGRVADNYPKHWGKVILNCRELIPQHKTLINEKHT